MKATLERQKPLNYFDILGVVEPVGSRSLTQLPSHVFLLAFTSQWQAVLKEEAVLKEGAILK